jgi:hypothetical protein
MLQVGDKFDIVYSGNKKLDGVCLAGRKFARLMSVLQRLQETGDKVESDLFDNGIPEALGLVIGDEARANQLWEEELTFREAIEILTQAVQGHVVGDAEVGK